MDGGGTRTQAAPRARRTRAAPRLARCGAALALAAWTIACQGAGGYDPLRIPEQELRARVRRIALASLRAPNGLVDRAAVQERVHALIASDLTGSGFEVVGADAMETAWREAAEAVGGLYDPKTGEADGDKWDAVREATYRELAAVHRVDAVLYTTLAVEIRRLDGREAPVCGRWDTLYWPASWSIGESATLVVNACLDLEIVDLDGRVLYSIRNGGDNLETFLQQTRSRRPVEERFADPQRLRRLVSGLLGRLTGAE